MRWLITGGCGFIGTALVRRLLKQGIGNIRIVDNLSVGSKEDLGMVTKFLEVDRNEIFENLPRSVQLIVGDILDEQLAINASKGCDVIVHLAANTGVGPSVIEPRKDMQVNVLGTFNYLWAAKENNVSRFIFASSGAPIGEVSPPIHEELAPHPVSPYGASKLAGEGYCSAFKRTYGLETVALRFGNVYGPGSLHKSSVVAKFIKEAINGGSLIINGDGNQTRDFIYIDDLINAIILASESPNIGGEVFQIASNSETTVNDLVSLLERILKESNLWRSSIVNAEPRIGDVRRNYSSTEKANNLLGWRPEKSLELGVKETISYFLEKKNES